MAEFEVRKQTSIKASPQVVFDIVSDLSRHPELAGSGEVLRIRKLSEGPMGLGTLFEADENLRIGDQEMSMTPKAVVVTYDPPNTISWIPMPPVPVRRIQWWFHLTPLGDGTQVVHEVEVDLGDGGRAMFGGLEGYRAARGNAVASGMDKTLENLRKAAE